MLINCQELTKPLVGSLSYSVCRTSNHPQLETTVK